MARIHMVEQARTDHGICEKCRSPIKKGDAYKWVAPRSHRAARGHKRVRCIACPTWQGWELSSSRLTAVWQAQSEFAEAIADAHTQDDMQSAVEELVSVVNEVADGYEESADAIEEGFQHPTSTSDELREKAETLRDWAGTLETLDIPDPDDGYAVDCEACGGSTECPTCEGSGRVDDASGMAGDCEECEGRGDCPECDGTGHSDEVDLDAWRQAVEDALSEAQDCPVS